MLMLTFYLREVPMSLHYSARVSSLLDAIANKLKPTKFHYASWFGAGSKLVRTR